jgi:hypothetical protein
VCWISSIALRAIDPECLFVCELCNRRLVTKADAIDHCVQKSHLDSLYESVPIYHCIHSDGYDVLGQNVIEPGLVTDPDGPIGKCSLCKSILHDNYQLEIHIESKRHVSNLRWFMEVHCAIANGKYLSNKIDRFLPNNVNEPGPWEEDDYSKKPTCENFLFDSSICKFIWNLPRGINVREWDYYCRFCDRRIHTRDDIDSHIETDKHREFSRLKKNL